MKKTIIQICVYNPLYGGNFIPSLLALAEKTHNLGYNTVFVFPKDAETRTWFKELSSISYINTETVQPSKNYLKTLFILNSFIHKYNAVIVHAHFYRELIVEILSILNPNVKMFIHEHSDFSAGKNRTKDKIKNFIKFVLFPGKCKFFSVFKSFQEKYPKQTIYLPNALSTERIICRHISGKEIRKVYGINVDDIFCELFGWSPLVKGVDIAADAIKKANELSGKHFVLGIVCHNKKQIKEYISNNSNCTGQEEYIKYLDPIENVYSYHEAADILISASRSEAFSYCLLEMLGIGKKCVVSDIPGTQWSMEYENTYGYKTEDSDECARALLLAASAKPAEDVPKRVKKKYSLDEWTRKIISEYGIENQL